MKQKKESFIKPTTDLSYDDILALFDDLEKGRYATNADFVLPLNFTSVDLGKNAAFCQFIATWFCRNPKSKVRIYDSNFPIVASELEQSVSKFCAKASLPALLAITFGVQSGIRGFSHKTRDYTSLFIAALQTRLKFDYRELSNYSSNPDLPHESVRYTG
jgi:hypothetical protein